MTKALLEELNGIGDVHVQAPAAPPIPFETHCGARLPTEHEALLSLANGISVYGGFYCLFGTDRSKVPNLVDWNEEDNWKFSWQDRANKFLCFGSTGWGDQYAYHIDTLHRSGDAPVFLLDAFSMGAEKISNNFTDFWKHEFIRNAVAPYDELTDSARQHLGDLKWNEAVAFTPPLQLGGTEDTATLSKMAANGLMIVNGDITTQLDALNENTSIQGIEHFEDGNGRNRIRVLTLL
jgi:hypothetical protein